LTESNCAGVNLDRHFNLLLSNKDWKPSGIGTDIAARVVAKSLTWESLSLFRV
jgi:hypothetical protein